MTTARPVITAGISRHCGLARNPISQNHTARGIKIPNCLKNKDLALMLYFTGYFIIFYYLCRANTNVKTDYL
jgi:hypothetical protein